MTRRKTPSTADTDIPNPGPAPLIEAKVEFGALSFRAHSDEPRKPPRKKPRNSGLDSLGGGHLP